jgi:uncharacterized RDD family membrane protein YckC
VKCPKCHYLGFDTGDRCKNCGYDFSLMIESHSESADGPHTSSGSRDDIDVDLSFRPSDDTLPTLVQWDDNFDADLLTSPATLELGEPPADPVESRRPAFDSRETAFDSLEPIFDAPEAPAPAPDRRMHATPDRRTTPERRLPLFPAAFHPDNDEPMITLPATPRAPLAVRRTPDTPRLRSVPRVSRPAEAAPVLEFLDDADRRLEQRRGAEGDRRAAPPIPFGAAAPDAAASGAGPRLAAVVIDHLLLGTVDVAVVYFTLRMTGLTMNDVAAVPLIPLLVFLLLVKLAYFCAFTAVGGQTIGKMALRIRVVTRDHGAVNGALAVRRTLAGAASAALFGLGFLPALVGEDRRALHDRLAGTRVVALPSA